MLARHLQKKKMFTFLLAKTQFLYYSSVLHSIVCSNKKGSVRGGWELH